MRSLQSLMNLISVALASVVVILLLGFVFILMLVVFPFVFIWTLFSSRKHFDEDIVAEFDRVYQAMTDGELTKLDELKKEIPDLPHGTDRFLERHWLTNAIDAGNLNAVAWVLDHGVEINFHEDDGISPLGSAIQGENLSIVQLLIDRGADVNLPGTLDVTPLHVAAALGTEDIVRALLKAGADPMSRDSDYGFERPIEHARHAKKLGNLAILEEAMAAHKGSD